MSVPKAMRGHQIANGKEGHYIALAIKVQSARPNQKKDLS